MKKIFLLVTFSLFAFSLFAGSRYIPITGGDGKISYEDIKTHLVFTQDYGWGTWNQALKYCEELHYGGFTNWRLPNINELGTLINIGKSYPASDFPNTSHQLFWSSSSGVASPGRAWMVSFDRGFVTINWAKSSGGLVRCVRN